MLLLLLSGTGYICFKTLLSISYLKTYNLIGKPLNAHLKIMFLLERKDNAQMEHTENWKINN